MADLSPEDRPSVTMEEVAAAMRIVKGGYPADFRAFCGLCLWHGPTRAVRSSADADALDHSCFAFRAAASLPVREPGERVTDASWAALEIMADPENWLGDPCDQRSTLHGHFTPHELARAALDALPSEPDAHYERMMLREAARELGCPDAPWCQSRDCPAAGEDDVCLVHEGIRALKAAALSSGPAHYPTREGPGFGDWRCACGGQWGTEADLQTHLRGVPSVREEPGLPGGWEGHSVEELDLYARDLGVDVEALILREGGLSAQMLRIAINRHLDAESVGVREYDEERPTDAEVEAAWESLSGKDGPLSHTAGIIRTLAPDAQPKYLDSLKAAVREALSAAALAAVCEAPNKTKENK